MRPAEVEAAGEHRQPREQRLLGLGEQPVGPVDGRLEALVVHLQRDDVVAHGAVAHRVGTRSARRRHAAQRCIGTGINPKEQSLVAQLLVQQLSRDAGLDDAVEVFRVHGEQPVHVARVDTDAAGRRVHLPFQRRAGAHRRSPALSAGRRCARRPGCLRSPARIRRTSGGCTRQPGRRVRVLVAHRLRGNETVAEARGQRLERAAQRGRVSARQFGGKLSHRRLSLVFRRVAKRCIKGFKATITKRQTGSEKPEELHDEPALH